MTINQSQSNDYLTHMSEDQKRRKELEDLDLKVNQFIEENQISKVVSVSDTTTTDDTGSTIGLIRVLAYE